MEAVKTLDRNRDELPGVEGSERSEGDDGNCGGPRWPGGCDPPERGCPITREGEWVASPDLSVTRFGWAGAVREKALLVRETAVIDAVAVPTRRALPR